MGLKLAVRAGIRSMLGVVVVSAGLSAGIVAAPGVTHADTAPPSGPATVSADALPTVQIDGVVWTQVVVGNTVYAGGKFTTARPAGAAPGTSTVTRDNLLAYNITTGQLISTFAPNPNGQVLGLAVSPDGSRLYVAGDFTSIAGASRYRVAAFTVSTGQLVSSFAPTLDYRARAVVATNSTVYVGGAFSSASGQSRPRLAAFAASNGAVLSWKPSTDAQVMSMVMAPDGSKLVVGGQFTNLNGVAAPGLGALNPTTGATVAFAANTLIHDDGSSAGVDALSTDGTYIYGSAFAFHQSVVANLEGTFAADPGTGRIIWVEDCHGDTYSNFGVNQVVYTVSHAHYCGNVGGWSELGPPTFQRATAFSQAATTTVKKNPIDAYFDFGGQPAPSLLTWWPTLDIGSYTGQSQAAWSVTGNSQYIVLGGEFPKVNGTAQQGLVRFAVSSIAPNKQGPALSGIHINPTLTNKADGVHVVWTADWDRDNTALTYRVIRNGVTSTPIYTTTVNSTFWNTPRLEFTDTKVTPGTTYKYQITATDHFGNKQTSANISITAGYGGGGTSYASTVHNDGASTYWRFGETSGQAVDSAGVNPGNVGAGVSRGAAGAIIGDSNTAYTFNGTSSGTVVATVPQTAPTQFSAEAWFKTTSNAGGQIIGFGNSTGGTSGTLDRMVYMDTAGRLVLGVYSSGFKTLASWASYNDGNWHQLVETLGSNGMALYVDGVLVTNSTTPTGSKAQSFTGYWHVGGDRVAGTGWPDAPASSFFAGTIDDVSVYPSVLTASQILTHYQRSGRD